MLHLTHTRKQPTNTHPQTPHINTVSPYKYFWWVASIAFYALLVYLLIQRLNNAEGYGGYFYFLFYFIVLTPFWSIFSSNVSTEPMATVCRELRYAKVSKET
jgi:hypothetical protein